MQFDLVHIWASMGILSKLVAFALVLMAISSIGVVVERMIALERNAVDTKHFAKEAVPFIQAWDTGGLLSAAEKHPRSALAKLVAAGVGRFERGLSDPEGGLDAVELARREIGRRREALSAEFRRGLGVLASVGSVAPFVGLLGTVIGIITAFQSIAVTGSGGLGAVSAGIAEALIVTALGLAVAIPSVLTFNYLSTMIVKLELGLERSAGELIDEMENEHGRKSGEHERKAQAA